MLAQSDWGSRRPFAPFADLHNHVVPGVDDGCVSLLDAVQSMRAFHKEGVGLVIATPHLSLPQLDGQLALRRRLVEIREAGEWLKERCARRHGMPELRLGQEIWAPDADSIGRVVDCTGAGLAGTRFLLVEFGFELGADPIEVIRAVRAAGREIVIAHPERYRYPAGADPLDTVRRWKDAGAFLQVNLGSVLGRYGAHNAGAEPLAWRLLETGLIHLLASDHHGANRPHILHTKVFARLAERGGTAVAELLLAENPRRIAQDQLPYEVEALPAPAEAGA